MLRTPAALLGLAGLGIAQAQAQCSGSQHLITSDNALDTAWVTVGPDGPVLTLTAENCCGIADDAFNGDLYPLIGHTIHTANIDCAGPIGASAFQNNDVLETVFIGEHVTAIGDNAFLQTPDLITVEFHPGFSGSFGVDIFFFGDGNGVNEATGGYIGLGEGVTVLNSNVITGAAIADVFCGAAPSLGLDSCPDGVWESGDAICQVSPCTSACELAADRTVETLIPAFGGGYPCNTTDCQDGEDECVISDCTGQWSGCSTECEAGYQRTWTQATPSLGGGAACPEEGPDCADGEGQCVYPATLTPNCPSKLKFERALIGMYEFIRSNQRLEAKLAILSSADAPAAVIQQGFQLTIDSIYLATLATDSNSDGVLSGTELAADDDGRALLDALSTTIATSLEVSPSDITIFSIDTTDSSATYINNAGDTGRRLQAQDGERVVSVSYSVRVSTLKDYVRTKDLVSQ